MVPEEGLEPSRTCVRQILSLLRLPLRHSGQEIETLSVYHNLMVGTMGNLSFDLRKCVCYTRNCR